MLSNSPFAGKRIVKKALFLVTLVALTPGVTTAAEKSYKFGISDQRTNITFESNTDFEVILGSTHKLSGQIVADLEAGTGRVEAEVPVASRRSGIDLRDKHLRSKKWLDAKGHPVISFVSSSARQVSGTQWEIIGTFTLHGVSREVSVTADVRPIPAAAARQAGLEKGDWLRVLVPLEIKLSDYGVKIPGKAAARVNDTWKVRILAFAAAR
ncbi:MAG: YceI family protein [Acidobacteriota bacterium]|nr:YceI family protein [Acidobacteriota bacterium]